MIDAHCHLDPELSVPELLGAMDRGGVGRAALIAAANTHVSSTRGSAFFCGCMNVRALRMPLYGFARKRMTQIERPGNDGVFAAAREHPDRFLPFAFVNPKLDAEAIDELDHRIEQGARGVKLHAWLHGYRLTDALPVLKRAEAKGLPVLAHLGFGPASDVAAVIDACPKLKLVCAHAGIPHFEELWKLERVSFDVAAAGLLIGARTTRRLIEAVGPARVIYGSDAPIGLRSGGAYVYAPPPLPDAAFERNALRLLDG